jgi:hypothetical protein
VALSRDIPFWVGCAAILAPKRHMRIDRLILCEPTKFERQEGIAQVGFHLTRTEGRPDSFPHMA